MFRSLFRSPLAIIVLALCAVPSAQAAWFYVGGDGGCQFSTVQAALNNTSNSSGHEVRIARNTTYNQQALTWNVAAGATLTLTGGFADCNQIVPDTTTTTLSGTGGAAASVLRINLGNGATVNLKNLVLRGGDPAGENPGGGLHITGNGTVRIDDSSIINNSAGNGGGIMFDGGGTGAKLVIGRNVVIAQNLARFSGGGVFIAGAAMDMLEEGSTIRFNSALGTPTTGYGGGLFVRARQNRPSRVRIGSTGVLNCGAICGNEARAGGGIAIRNFNDDQRSTVDIYTNRADRRAAVQENAATVAGGGIFVQSGNNDDDWAILRLWNADVIDNIAPDGAALYFTYTPIDLNWDTGPLGRINNHVTTFGQVPEGAIPCTRGVPCGEISGNQTKDANGQFTQGAIILVNKHARLSVGTDVSVGGGDPPGSIAMRGNRGGRLIDAVEDRSQQDNEVFLRNMLLVDNIMSLELIRDQSDWGMYIQDTTIAGNTLGAGHPVIRANNTRNLGSIRRSIIAQPGHTSLVQSSGSYTVSETISNDPASLGGAPGARNLQVRFIDPARGDYRLRAGSRAVDYAAIADGVDIGSEPRNVDLPFKPDAFGPRDVGAFERQSLYPLVLNGRFDTDLRLWSNTPGTSFDPAQSQDAGTGSAYVSAPSPANGARVLGARQCIYLPGPGRYLLNGYGRSPGFVVSDRDSLYLNWQLRHADGLETCGVGFPNAEGDHFLSRSSAWVQPQQPAVIDLPLADWTPDSTLVVTLVVVDNGISIPREATGWFDGITLTVTALDDVIFANGFE